MALIRFRPLSHELTDIQSQMNRIFEGFLGSSATSEAPERVWAPAADMYETKNEVVVTAELPGLTEKDVHVSITGDLLTIQGERRGESELEDASHYRRERWFGKFVRTFSLPVPVETSQIKATYRDGVLTVKLPKSEEIKAREIKVEAA
ncbi:MAG TPA: Hsp20/alpha crystallin family protein [Methylomirabilota bacterium]